MRYGRSQGPVLNPGLLDQPHLAAAPIQRRPISTAMLGDENDDDRADRTSDGLPPSLNNVPIARYPWIAKHALCMGALDR